MARNSQKSPSEEAPKTDENKPEENNDAPPPPDPKVDDNSGIDSEIVDEANTKVDESDVYSGSDDDEDEDTGETLGEAEVSEADIQKVLDQFGDKIPSSAIREEIVAELRGLGDSPTLRACAGIGDEYENEDESKSDEDTDSE